jgi:putative flippase GtrA
MDLSPRGVFAYARSPEGTKLFRYTMVSLISVAVSEVALFGALHFLQAVWANVVAVVVGTVPSYELNRRWAWGKTGKGHLWREVVPFWVLSFIGLLVSTGAVAVAAGYVGHSPSTLSGKLVINATNLGAFGVLWVAKFVIFNKVLFAHHTQDLDPVFDGRSGFPT